MGTWGYAPCDGDGPCDMESEVHYAAIAPYLIKLFKKPLRKGSQKFVRMEVMSAELKKAGLARLKGKRGKPIDSRALRRLWKKRKELRTKILRRKDPSLYHEIQDASQDRWSRLGLVQLLSERGVGIPISVVKKCRGDLKALAKDEGFADIWDSSKLFTKSVSNMLKNVELILARDKIQQCSAKQRRARSRRSWPKSRKGPRLVYDAFLRDRPGERRWKGCLTLLPIPQRKTPRRRRKAKKAKKKA